MRNTSSNTRVAKRNPIGSAQAERVAAYSRQLGNVRSALEWSFGSHGNDEIATRLAVASTQPFMELSLLAEWQGWAEQAMARLEGRHRNSGHEIEGSASLPLAMRQDLAHEFRLLSGLFLYSSWTTEIHRALDIAARSQRVALKIRDPDDMAFAETMLAPPIICGKSSCCTAAFRSGSAPLGIGSRLRAGHYLFHHTTLSLAAWRALCCTGACSTNHWTTQGSRSWKGKNPATRRHCADPDLDSPCLSGAGRIGRARTSTSRN